MKTSELTGHALNWAVARCEGGVGADQLIGTWYSPSTNWAQGGPIIEREKMSLSCGDGTWGVAEGKWEASHPKCLYVEHGATPLEAAMRCYVVSVLGDEVEIPEEINKET